MSRPAFLMITCQVGAEAAVKGELAAHWPALRFAYSRPGFLTFKLPEEAPLADDFQLGSIFARSWCFSLGKVQDDEPAALAAGVWKLAEGRTFDRLHVWPRDRAAVGEHGFQPSITPQAADAAAAIQAAAPEGALGAAPFLRPAKRGDAVLDCVLVGEREWWIGHHHVQDFASRFAGGLVDLKLPESAVSRAYLKMEEALRWSRLPVKWSETFAELGCSPGGAAQALLRRGLYVIGVDPALVDPVVAGHPRFTQIRKRGNEVRRREFRRIKWLASDMNVAPQYTLDTVESIVTYPQNRIRGLLLTLKLPDWKLAAEVPQYLERVRSWGYPDVRARQLQYNRQEICVAALRPKRVAPKQQEE